MAACCHGSQGGGFIITGARRGPPAQGRRRLHGAALCSVPGQGRMRPAALGARRRGRGEGPERRHGARRRGASAATLVVALLLDFGADASRALDAEDGCTPLMNAAYGANAEVTKVLVRRQPQCVEMRDDLGRTARDR